MHLTPPIRSACVLVLLSMATGSLGASVRSIVAHPKYPGVGVPFQLVISGQWPFGEPVGGYETRVEVEGTTIRVSLDVAPPPPFPPPPGLYDYAFTADVEGLSGLVYGGAYDVELWVSDSLGPSPVLWHTDAIDIDLGVQVSTRPPLPVDDEPVTITVSGVASCFSHQPPVVDGDTISIAAGFGCPILPPPPSPFEFDVTVGPLPAGTYRIVVGEAHFVENGVAELTVLPSSVPLAAGRFLVDVDWQTADGAAGIGRPARPPSEDSALFWFFRPDNWELMVKVLDGCGANGHYWVLGSASTNVAYSLEITDQTTAATWSFANSLGELSPAFTDTEAFPCD